MQHTAQIHFQNSSYQQQQQQQEQQNNNATTTKAKTPSPRPTYIPASSPTSSDENDADFPNSRYLCAICLSWLNEPVLTACGHRFCKSCLNDWLRKENHNCCPLDNKKLSAEQDIFPDNYTRREIDQIKVKCPNSLEGCMFIDSPIAVNRHLSTCPYRPPELTEEKCPFASIKCDFVGRPETNALEEHLKDDMPHHLQLMLKAFQEAKVNSWNAPHKPSNSGKQQMNGHAAALPPPPQYANEADEQLIGAMYQRIVVLEQRAREQEAKVENLTKQLTHLNTESRTRVDPRYSHGIIVWEISNFKNLIEQLRINATEVYSRECYTSPYGYKFCARLNIKPKKDHMLSLHVHLMQSENDFHLEWPFRGRIKLCMVHPRDPNLTQQDTIMTKPEILAFHQPRERISTRGFGFVEYAHIAEIVEKGFCENDRIVLKIQINIV